MYFWVSFQRGLVSILHTFFKSILYPHRQACGRTFHGLLTEMLRPLPSNYDKRRRLAVFEKKENKTSCMAFVHDVCIVWRRTGLRLTTKYLDTHKYALKVDPGSLWPAEQRVKFVFIPCSFCILSKHSSIIPLHWFWKSINQIRRPSK